MSDSIHASSAAPFSVDPETLLQIGSSEDTFKPSAKKAKTPENKFQPGKSHEFSRLFESNHFSDFDSGKQRARNYSYLNKRSSDEWLDMHAKTKVFRTDIRAVRWQHEKN